MRGSILIAGIGNIFNRDDAFGVFAVARLSGVPLPRNVKVVDFGIRGIDLVLALASGYETAILVDAVSRGEPPGTLYTIEVDGIPQQTESELLGNAHGLDPWRALAAARSMGASLGRVFVVGCEPATLGDDTGEIGLSKAVQEAIEPAVKMIRSLVKDVNNNWTAIGVQTGKA